jgi:hypothetical protein
MYDLTCDTFGPLERASVAELLVCGSWCGNCALIPALLSGVVSPHAHGEDCLRPDRGADRAIFPATGEEIEHIGSAHDDGQLEV